MHSCLPQTQSKLAANEQNTEMKEQVKSKNAVAMEAGFACKEGEQTKGREMKLTR